MTKRVIILNSDSDCARADGFYPFRMNELHSTTSLKSEIDQVDSAERVSNTETGIFA